MSEKRLLPRMMATLVLAGVLVGAGAAPALADPAYSSDGCDINRAVDGPVSGGSKCAGADLSGAKLAQSAFQGADLSGATLARADVQDSNFQGANLTGTNFSATRIVSADFTGAGILPATLDVTADSATGGAVTLTPTLPTGLTMTGCTIAGEAVESGAVFPLGQSGVVCSFASSRPNETATALVKINVTTPATTATAPPVPVFTETPAARAPSGAASQGLPAGTMNILLFGGGGVLLLGIVALVVRGALGSRRPRGRS
ncbi:pentapeptide repeat-containing protein [Subtercola boreus]|uniref:pentapeptide repeat-containing protein n=1 Tax=Subtercola boreus TaxID=120213 RepID=UPI00155846C5|nr:pentapeptide repeat-containing protein [Subtercola boreus]